MEEFRSRCTNLLQRIDSLPKTGREEDDDNRNVLKENVVALAKIDEQIDQLLGRPDQKEALRKLETQLNREWLAIVTLWHEYRRGGGDFGEGFRNAFIEANNLVEALKRVLEEIKKGSDRRGNPLIR